MRKSECGINERLLRDLKMECPLNAPSKKFVPKGLRHSALRISKLMDETSLRHVVQDFRGKELKRKLTARYPSPSGFFDSLSDTLPKVMSELHMGEKVSHDKQKNDQIEQI